MRSEMIFKVLAWGMVVYFLALGYSISQSSLFEFWPAELKDSNKSYQVITLLKTAKMEHATRLEEEAQQIKASASPPVTDIDDKKLESSPENRASAAAKLRVEAAQLRADVYLAQEEQKDGRGRAIGLMVGALIFGVAYPIVVWFVYKRTDAGGETEKDLVPVRWALVYAVFMSIATCWTALATALR